MMHSTHGIDGTRNMVIYACPHTNRTVFKNGGNCFRVRASTMVISLNLDEVPLVDDGMKGSESF